MTLCKFLLKVTFILNVHKGMSHVTLWSVLPLSSSADLITPFLLPLGGRPSYGLLHVDICLLSQMALGVFLSLCRHLVGTLVPHSTLGVQLLYLVMGLSNITLVLCVALGNCILRNLLCAAHCIDTINFNLLVESPPRVLENQVLHASLHIMPKYVGGSSSLSSSQSSSTWRICSSLFSSSMGFSSPSIPSWGFSTVGSSSSCSSYSTSSWTVTSS